MTKPLLFVLAGIALAALPAAAQTRLIVGATGGESYSNTFIGVDAKVEQPLMFHVTSSTEFPIPDCIHVAGDAVSCETTWKKEKTGYYRFELDAEDTYSPLEWHTGYGRGWANKIGGGPLVWLRLNFGFTGGLEQSSYTVTKLAKSSSYFRVGPVFRSHLGDAPLRVYLSYVRQFANGIDRRGVETNRLQAGEFRLEGRIGCKGPVCFRSITEFSVGSVEDQGNPRCDGAWRRHVTCPRQQHLSGSGYGGIMVEWPRPKGHEYEAF